MSDTRKIKRLMKGNEAVIHGALMGGATHFFGYPITPASEIAHAAALYFTSSGRHFLQAGYQYALRCGRSGSQGYDRILWSRDVTDG